uniref:Uncharacterized protein n=1 Tax=Spongospora subterranea TaxID=70186 RepID=A0A0H5QXT5_9EUKA|eukprot:CRZ06760.1 hypothetical protein [Spongospora subterranea]
MSCCRCPVCSMELRHHPCECAIMWVQHFVKDRCIIIHDGNHEHKIPHVKKPDHYGKQALKDIVMAAPRRTAQQLLVPTPGTNAESVRRLSSSFVNRDRLGYFRRSILKEMGITMPGNV